MRQKVIRDVIHGYIYIDEYILEHIIDTRYFQRLRRIEQTSMRVLYPAARHDRFIHSIGTYFLGKRAIEFFYNNITFYQDRVIPPKWQEIKDSYLTLLNNSSYWCSRKFNFAMACLLHDIGHAPFSHTLEDFYAKERQSSGLWDIFLDKAVNKGKLNNEVAELIKSKGEDPTFKPPATHEILSAILVLEEFTEPLKNLAVKMELDPSIVDMEFIVRCIMGLHYEPALPEMIDNKVWRNMDNCLIQLLNGETFDVDRLDYLLRDARMAGYDCSAIDSERLLKALTIEIDPYKYEFRRALKKSALSVIESFINAYNELYIWAYGHHKVIYYAELYKQTINAIDTIDIGFIENFFSYNKLKRGLTCDDDVWLLLKEYESKVWQAGDIISRTSLYQSMWKACTDFRIVFYPLRAYELDHDKKYSPLKTIHAILDTDRTKADFTQKFLQYIGAPTNYRGQNSLILVNAKIKELRRNSWSLNIYMDDKEDGSCCVKFVDLMETASSVRNAEPEPENALCFYLYLHEDFLKQYPTYNSKSQLAKKLMEFYHQEYKWQK